MQLPWFIPQLRVVEDRPEDIRPTGEFFEESSESEEGVVREYRDEANRPWWKVFDEYEYRDTTAEAKRHKNWRWYPEGTAPAEKTLLFKLDLCLALYTFLGYFIKYVDSSNLNSAYISGMKEDLGMKGNDLINTQMIFTIGNIIFELPWIFLLPRMSLTYALFYAECGWSILTLVTSLVQKPGSLKAIRFLVAAFESPFFPIAHYSQASWYTSDEVGRRLGFMYFGQCLGVLVSSLIASGAVQSAPDGIAGWRFMFILDGVVSFAVAILGLFCHPGTPLRPYSIWLTDDEIRLARARMRRNGSDVDMTVKAFFDKKTWKKIASSWHIYLLSIIQMCGFNTNSATSGSFGLWLKSLDKYSISKLNQLAAIPPALGIVWIFIVCFGADFTRKRFAFIFFSYVMNFAANIILAIWDVSTTAKWVGFCLTYWAWSQSSVFNPLISDMMRYDQNERAIVWMIVYIAGLQSSAWVNRLTFPTVDLPRFPKGFSSCAGFSVAFNLLLVVAYYYYRRDERRNALRNGIYVYNSKTDTVPEAALLLLEGSVASGKKADFGEEVVAVSESD